MNQQLKSVLSITLAVLLASCATNERTRFHGGKLESSGLCKENKLEQSDNDAIPCMVRAPNYPRKALMNRIEGHVMFSLTVTKEGKPINIKIIESIPEGIFDKDALKAFSVWSFKPKFVNGLPVREDGQRYTMEFKLG